MHKFIEKKSWEGNAEALAKHAKSWMRVKRIGDPAFEPNERLVRDYVARGILSKPERKGKEAVFGFEQLAQFLACRAMIEDGWPLMKIAEDFGVSSLSDILNLVPGESPENDALDLIADFKADAIPSASESGDGSVMYSRKYSASYSALEPSESRSFLRRSRDSYETRADIKDVLRRLGSDFGNVIREDFTAYQLASWLVLLIDRDKAQDITRRAAEDIGRGITAALLNRSSLTKADRIPYTKQMKELSSLDQKIRDRQYELERIENKQAQLEIEIKQRMNLLEDLEERLRKMKE